NNQHRTITQLVEDRLGTREEEQVRVEIGDNAGVRVCAHQIQRQRRGAREVVLDQAPVRLGFEQRRITALEIFERDRMESRQRERLERLACQRVEAEYVQRELAGMLNQRFMQRQASNQVVAVEAGAEVTHR